MSAKCHEQTCRMQVAQTKSRPKAALNFNPDY
jgi:hypothetical protein